LYFHHFVNLNDVGDLTNAAVPEIMINVVVQYIFCTSQSHCSKIGGFLQRWM
jgi:hypothetical protein